MPFGVLISWDKGNRTFETNEDGTIKIREDGNFVYKKRELDADGNLPVDENGNPTDDANLLMAEEKYPYFIFPEAYYFMPPASVLIDNYTSAAANTELHALIEKVFSITKAKIDVAVEAKKYFVTVLFSEINNKDTSKLVEEFTTGTESRPAGSPRYGKIHIWKSTNGKPLSIYIDNKKYIATTTIKDDEKYSIPFLLSNAIWDPSVAHTEKQQANAADIYRELYNSKNELIGYILSWHGQNNDLSDAEHTQIEKDIKVIKDSFAYEPTGNEETLILSVYDHASLVEARKQQIKEMRTNYIAAICDKIQSKLATAFKQSTNGAVILWTEIAPNDPCSVLYEWHNAGGFTKILQAQSYDPEEQTNTDRPKIEISKENYAIMDVLQNLNIASFYTSESENGVYWDYVYYKNIQDKIDAGTLYVNDTPNEQGEYEIVPASDRWEYSCGIAVVYSETHAMADKAMRALKKEFGKTTDPAIKKNNTNYTQGTANGVLRKQLGYYTEVQKEIKALSSSNQ